MDIVKIHAFFKYEVQRGSLAVQTKCLYKEDTINKHCVLGLTHSSEEILSKQ